MKTRFIKWHSALIWFGLTTIIIWAISGISHPLMTWLGPQPVKMFPPALSITVDDTKAVQQVIKQHHLTEAAIAKIVPTAEGPMLQLTQTEGKNDAVTRRYFSLTDYQEQPNYDQQQARWLAAYYAGRDINQISRITYITEFSTQYPSVNRLLPVYRVELAGEDGLTIFIHTETNALASINNQTKQMIQSVFQALHTWSFLDFTGFGRVLLIALFMLTLITMAITGALLVISLARRPIDNPARRWHRSLAYALWLPMLAWPASGFYHLLQAHYVDNISGMRLSEPLNLQQWLVPAHLASTWQDNLTTALGEVTKLNAVSLVKNHDHHYYRLSLAQPQDSPVTRQARFDGKPVESGVIYIDSQIAEISRHTDKAQAITLLHRLIGQETPYKNIKLVTHFGPGYDFRNKRLPVWEITLDDSAKTHVFVDPMTSIIVDQNRHIDRLEGLSFSVLHKWSHLTPFIGRPWRDITMVTTLVACLALAGLGFQMYRRRRSQTTSS